MATEVVMPQMGESIAEGTITRWLVKVGEKVERDQPLFEISTDKVDAEIPSPAAGVLLEIRNQEGETVPVNQVVAMIGEAGPRRRRCRPLRVRRGPPPRRPRRLPRSGRGACRRQLLRAAAAARRGCSAPAGLRSRRLRRLARRARPPAVEPAGAQHGRQGGRRPRAVDRHRYPRPGDQAGHARLHRAGQAAARSQAALAAPSPRRAGRAAPAPRQGLGPASQVAAYQPGENVTIEPMSKIRQITAAHMRYSKDTSAHVTTVFHMDFTKVDRIRARAKDKFFKMNGTKLSYMPFIFKSVAAALRAHPKVNASIDGTNVVFKKDINIGMAVALDWGLLVPVIRNADQLNLLGLAKAANDLADRARSKKLGPDELKGGTFTITNPGVFGSLFGTPVINQPQVAILGIGAIEKRPMVMSDADGCDTIAIRVMSYFGITYDHRLVDGADADHFMNSVKKMLESDAWPELEPYL